MWEATNMFLDRLFQKRQNHWAHTHNGGHTLHRWWQGQLTSDENLTKARSWHHSFAEFFAPYTHHKKFLQGKRREAADSGWRQHPQAFFFSRNSKNGYSTSRQWYPMTKNLAQIWSNSLDSAEMTKTDAESAAATSSSHHWPEPRTIHMWHHSQNGPKRRRLRDRRCFCPRVAQMTKQLDPVFSTLYCRSDEPRLPNHSVQDLWQHLIQDGWLKLEQQWKSAIIMDFFRDFSRNSSRHRHRSKHYQCSVSQHQSETPQRLHKLVAASRQEHVD